MGYNGCIPPESLGSLMMSVSAAPLQTHLKTRILSPLAIDPLAIDKARLETEVLPHVLKPARYLGLEQGAFRKSFAEADVTMVAAFPDLYEIGFSNYGLKLLYSLVNRQPGLMCDRVYAPAPDFRDKLKECGMPLYGVESFVPLRHFDVVAFSLQYELNYTTIFGLLESAGIPFRSADRPIGPTNVHPDGFPLLIAGGPGSANPMPLAPFIDVFIIGDGEEVLLELLEVVRQGKREAWERPALLQRLAGLEGLYIPSVTTVARKRIVDIAKNPVELAPLIPLVGAVHDRVTVEARRGCDRMCRFCQPCFINLPVREQSVEAIRTAALREIEKTGYEECSLLSLSIADYSYFKPLILDVAGALKEKNVSLSLPSQRADRFSLEVAEAVQSIRKSTLTFAPEAGTPRLRDVINKNLTDAEILEAVTTAYRAGWDKVKLYFIIGLPTETHDDLDGIVDMVRRLQKACVELKRQEGLKNRNPLDVHVTLSNFVPKPHTPFQWFPQDSLEQLAHKIDYLKEKFRPVKGVKINYTDPEISKLEAVISRGGPELADVIEAAYRKGAYLDAWDDLRNFDRWFEALNERGICPEAYTRDRCCDPAETLPWDPIDVGLDKAWLETEYRRATEATGTTPCFEICSECGVCPTFKTWPSFIDKPAVLPGKVDDKPDGGASGGPEAGSGAEIPRLKREPVCKVRLKLYKRDGLRFISHLDWLRMIYRAIARSGIPAAYSQGFNPRPKVAFGPALGLFTGSECEYLDIELTERRTDVAERLNPYLPPEGQIREERLLPLSASGIDVSIRRLRYRAEATASAGDIVNTACAEGANQVNMTERIAFLKAQSALRVEVEVKSKEVKNSKGRRRKAETHTQVLDLVPYLEDLEAEGERTISFSLRRFPDSEHPENPLGAESKAGLVSGFFQVKPRWVLDLIHPGGHWSLVRTGIELDS
jgi:radical SAM-linked protein